MSGFGSLGFFGATAKKKVVKKVAAPAVATARIVKLTGGFHVSDDIDILQSEASIYQAVKDSIINNGWNANNINFATNNNADYAITLDVTALPNDDANRIRLGVLAAINAASIGGWFSDSKVTSTAFMQILNDGAKVIATTDQTKQVKQQNPTRTDIVVDATEGAVKQIQKDGVIAPVTDFWATLLGGEPYDLLGLKVPKVLVYSAAGFLIYDKVIRK